MLFNFIKFDLIKLNNIKKKKVLKSNKLVYDLDSKIELDRQCKEIDDISKDGFNVVLKYTDMNYDGLFD